MRQIIAIIFTLLTGSYSFTRLSFHAPRLFVPQKSSLLKFCSDTTGGNEVHAPPQTPEGINAEDVSDSTEQSLDDSQNITAIDPLAEMIKAKESELNAQITTLESTLRYERSALLKTRDKLSESGKNGFFIVQAQRKKEVEQQERVKRNKRDFVKNMLPVVDSFRAARSLAPPSTEREEKMHDTFGSLLTSILTVFEKYGFKEFDAAVDVKYDPVRHEVKEMREGEPDGIVLEQVRQGVEDSEGAVFRRALVIIGKIAEPEPAPEPEPEPEPEASAEESDVSDEDKVGDGSTSIPKDPTSSI